ncbi:unnamed protein product [Calypogeia fissa]
MRLWRARDCSRSFEFDRLFSFVLPETTAFVPKLLLLRKGYISLWEASIANWAWAAKGELEEQKERKQVEHGVLRTGCHRFPCLWSVPFSSSIILLRRFQLRRRVDVRRLSRCGMEKIDL